MGISVMRKAGVAVTLAGLLLAPAAMAADKAPVPGPGGDGSAMTAEHSKMMTMRQEHRKALEPLRKKMQILMDELRLMLSKDAKDSDLSAKMAEIKKVREEIRVLSEKHMAELTAMLSVRMQAEMMVRIGDGMMQGGHGMGGPGMGGHGMGAPGMGGPGMHGEKRRAPEGGPAGKGPKGPGGPADPHDSGDKAD